MEWSFIGWHSFMISPSHRANDVLLNLDDESLAAKLSMGHHQALAILFDRHSSAVFRLSKRILGDVGEAEDTVQEVFMEAYERISQFDPRKGTFRTWLIRKAFYRAIDRKRRLESNGFYQTLPIISAVATPNIDSPQLSRFSRDELRHLLSELLGILSDGERRVIELHLFRDLTLEETRQVVKASLSKVRHLYYGAMDKLRAAMGSEVKKPDNDTPDPQPRKAGGHASS